jgi:flavin-dependent dehydrogenase
MNAVVIGGGPAGAAVAARLGRAGADVVLLEREPGPADKVCGEFLSREASLYLESLGVDLEALGAVPIDTVRLCDRSHVTTVPLPFSAVSLSRRILDEALLERAVASGANVKRGTSVTQLARAGARWNVGIAGGTRIETDAVFLATGKHDLRGHKRPAGLQNDLIAFKLHWHLAPRQTSKLERHVELILFDGGYAGLQPIEGGRANLCLVVRRRRFRSLEQRWDKLLAALLAESPQLRERLTDATPCWERPLAISTIPYGYVQRHASEHGLWRLGDQAAVIPSFSGDGMSIALHSAELAASMYLEGRSADAYQTRLSHDVRGQVLFSTAVSHGLVRRAGQIALSTAARLWPSIVSKVASHTRVSDAALARTALASQEFPPRKQRETALADWENEGGSTSV